MFDFGSICSAYRAYDPGSHLVNIAVTEFTFLMYLNLFATNKDLTLYLSEQIKHCVLGGGAALGWSESSWPYNVEILTEATYLLLILRNVIPTSSVYCIEDMMCLMEGMCFGMWLKTPLVESHQS